MYISSSEISNNETNATRSNATVGERDFNHLSRNELEDKLGMSYINSEKRGPVDREGKSECNDFVWLKNLPLRATHLYLYYTRKIYVLGVYLLKVHLRSGVTPAGLLRWKKPSARGSTRGHTCCRGSIAGTKILL